MTRWAFGETITLHSKTLAADPDADGNDVYTTTDTVLTNIAVYPRGFKGNTAEQNTGKEDTTVTDIVAHLPYETDITHVDTITVYGTEWEVFGVPIRYRSPITGQRFLMVVLVRWTG